MLSPINTFYIKVLISVNTFFGYLLITINKNRIKDMYFYRNKQIIWAKSAHNSSDFAHIQKKQT